MGWPPEERERSWRSRQAARARRGMLTSRREACGSSACPGVVRWRDRTCRARRLLGARCRVLEGQLANSSSASFDRHAAGVSRARRGSVTFAAKAFWSLPICRLDRRLRIRLPIITPRVCAHLPRSVPEKRRPVSDSERLGGVEELEEVARPTRGCDEEQGPPRRDVRRSLFRLRSGPARDV